MPALWVNFDRAGPGLLGELRRLSERPTLAEVLERISQRPRVKLTTSAAAVIRRERDSR